MKSTTCKQIIFTSPCVAKLSEVVIPAPGPGEVQVRLMVSTISSGTERALLIGETNVSVYERFEKAVFPRISGYSSAGIIEAVGAGVSDLQPGDRVAVSWSIHSQVFNISRELVYKLEDTISFKDGALFHIATFPLAAIRKCHVEIGESAVIMGMGVLGLIAIPLLKLAGAAPVIAVDPVAEKRQKAQISGADYALDPYAADFADTVKRLTGGGANVAIEVTGVGKALDGVLDCMAKMGRVALLGCTRNSDFTIDYYHKVHGPGISLIGAHTAARPMRESSNGLWSLKDDVFALSRLTGLGRLKLSELVDEVYTPAKAEEVYARLAVEKSFPFTQFDWTGM